MTQSTMRIHTAPAPSSKPKTKPMQAPKQKAKVTTSVATKPKAKAASAPAPAAAPASKQQDQRAQHNQADSQPRPAETPSDVIANAASEAKEDKGVFASMKRAASPYVEHHSHAVLYGILGFIAAALILIVGFWPTVLLALFAAVGVIIGKYRDGDRATRQQMRRFLNRFN